MNYAGIIDHTLLKPDAAKEQVLVILAAFLFIGAALEIYREVHHFRTIHYEVSSQKLSDCDGEIRLIFLSDLHNRSYGKDNETLIDAIREERPDLILIGGDMLVGKPGVPCDVALSLAERLTAVCPVYYALGNHEGRMKEQPDRYGGVWVEYKTLLERRGVIFLENAAEPVCIRGQKIVLCGLELPVFTYRKFRKAEINGDDIQRYLAVRRHDRLSPCTPAGRIPSDAQKPEGDDVFTILMAHNPAYMDAYLKWGADLVLSGHLHGGLVRVPGLGGVITPQGFLFPKYSGELTRVGRQTVIVSRGLGTHTLNIRLFNMPELIAVRLKKSL